jgi:hypothetical protein
MLHPVVRRLLARRIEVIVDHVLAIALGVTLAWLAAQGF